MPSGETPRSGSVKSMGTSISPAPCADDIRNDHAVSERKPTRILTQRGCESGRRSLNTPSPMTTRRADYLERGQRHDYAG